MNLSNHNLDLSRNETNSNQFVQLKQGKIVEYNFLFRLKEKNHLKQLNEIKAKRELEFIQLESKMIELNLMMVDSILPSLFSDLVLEVFLIHLSSFKEYTHFNFTKKENTITLNQDSLNYKFNHFIHHLLFAKNFLSNNFTGVLDYSKIFYLKDKSGEIKYYSIYDQNKLQELLYQKIKLSINSKKSDILKDRIKLCLSISIDELSWI